MLILFQDNKSKGLIILTRKLYWERPYDNEFTATVKLIQEGGIILDQTLFYPFGGNQLSDQGILTIIDNNLIVSKVTKKNNEILHHISSNSHKKLKVGDTVIAIECRPLSDIYSLLWLNYLSNLPSVSSCPHNLRKPDRPRAL